MKLLLLACGALAREVIALRDRYAWPAEVLCVPALLHNTPGKIPPAIERRIREVRSQYAQVVVVYGDCGTSGALDDALARLGVERIAGPHCFEQFGGTLHDALLEETPGTFFLTDFLVRHFDGLVWRGLGLDRFPQLREDYFGNYQQVVYLAQTSDNDLLQRAKAAAARLDLPFRVENVGYGDFEIRLRNVVSRLVTVDEPIITKPVVQELRNEPDDFSGRRQRRLARRSRSGVECRRLHCVHRLRRT